MDSSSCRSYLKLNAYPLLESLNSETVKFLNYRTVRVLPELLNDLVAVEPAIAGERLDSLKESLGKRLDYYRYILGELDESGLNEDQRAELTRHRDSSSGESVNIVLVSTLSSEKGSYFNIGKVLKGGLNIEVTGEGSLLRPAEPFISFENRVSEKKDPFIIQLENSVVYAERTIEGRYSSWETARIPRVYRFGIREAGGGPAWAEQFTGGSAGLAFTLLAKTALDNFTSTSAKTKIKNDVAFTGGVDGDGNITGVEDSGIPLKVAAAFYSPCRRFVLPEDNLKTASEELDSLSSRYPGREFELVPVKHFSEIYDNPLIIEKLSKPALRLLASRAGRWKKHLYTAAAVCFAAVMMAIFLPPRLERRITWYEFDGETVTFFNKYNYGFDSFTPGYFILKKNNNYMDASCKSHRFYLEDIDGSGGKELLFLSVESDSNATRPVGTIHIHLFSDSGELISHKSLWDSVVIERAGRMDSYCDFQYCYDQLVDIDDDGFGEFVISSVDIEYSPSITAVVSLRDSVYKYYYHRGHLKRFITGDFAGDGRKEIFLGGDWNENENKQNSVISVIDPEAMVEHRFGEGIEIDSSSWKNPAVYYIKIPFSEMCRAMEECIRPDIFDITVGPDNNPKVGVRERENRNRHFDLFFRFGRDMSCYNVTLTDPYINKFARFFGVAGEELSERLKAVEIKLKEGFRYFDGRDWVEKPVINSIYRELIAERNRQQEPGQL